MGVSGVLISKVTPSWDRAQRTRPPVLPAPVLSADCADFHRLVCFAFYLRKSGRTGLTCPTCPTCPTRTIR